MLISTQQKAAQILSWFEPIAAVIVLSGNVLHQIILSHAVNCLIVYMYSFHFE